jgi:Uma2 family endonuclease
MLEVLEIPEIRNSLVPLSLADYEFLCKNNPEFYENTELFRGVVIEKMTKSSEHDFYSQSFYEELKKITPQGFLLRVEKGIQIQGSDLEPDISVIEGSLKDFKHQKPNTARLVVEISVSSLVYDRNKALDYARANVNEYWIVDVEHETVEVYTEPSETGFKKVNNYNKKDVLTIFSGQIELEKIFD